jgi:antitoxin HicB
MKTQKMKYEMVICWSEEDNCYLVGFPDFPGQQWRTHGDTYEIAATNGVEALESLVLAYGANGDLLPEPSTTATLLLPAISSRSSLVEVEKSSQQLESMLE